jgi:hypothetical protein
VIDEDVGDRVAVQDSAYGVDVGWPEDTDARAGTKLHPDRLLPPDS